MGFEKIKNLLGVGEKESYWKNMSDEELSRELSAALEERKLLGPRLKKIKGGTGAERGSTGSIVQRKMLSLDDKIAGLREEWERRFGKEGAIKKARDAGEE